MQKHTFSIYALIVVLLSSALVSCAIAPTQPTEPIVRTVDSPIFCPAGGNVGTNNFLTIISGTEGANIYYTTDGSEPTSSSSSYTAPVSFATIGMGSRRIIKAIAVRAGYANSAIVTATFPIAASMTIAAPTFSPEEGNVLLTQSLTMNTFSRGASIHYSTDGSDPNASSPQYISALEFSTFESGPRTIKAVALRDCLEPSDITSAEFIIPPKILAPSFYREDGTRVSTTEETALLQEDSVTIRSDSAEVRIHYTTDGRDPTPSSPQYSSALNSSTAPFTIGTHTVKAIAVKDSSDNSLITSAITTATFNVRYPSTVATPTFMPVTTTVRTTDELTISITPPDDEASIYYKTDASEPGPGTLYTPPLLFGDIVEEVGRHSIMATATREGFNPSTAEKVFIIRYPDTLTLLPPIFDPDPRDGAVGFTQTLSMRSNMPGVTGITIYYSKDGSDPKISPGNRYSEPISFNEIGTGEAIIKAIAVKDGYNNSPVTVKKFHVGTYRTAEVPGFYLNNVLLSTPGVTVIHTNSPLRIRVPSGDRSVRYRYTIDAIDASDRSVPGPESPELVGDETLPLDTLELGSYIIRASAFKVDYTPSLTQKEFSLQRDVDADNNGLIEIDSLEMLNNIRYNLAGTSYDDEEADSGDGDTGSVLGAHDTAEPDACNDDDPTTRITLCGYELTKNLDFARRDSYDRGVLNTDWRPSGNPDLASNEGFPGIGPETSITSGDGFTAIFEGNNHTIRNLYSRNVGGTNANTGLFRFIDSGAVIRNLGVTNARVYGTDSLASDDTEFENVGILAGITTGTIRNSYSTGTVRGRGGKEYIGGLVGTLNLGTVTDSYSTAEVTGDDADDIVGGLIGFAGGRIIASYSTGRVNGNAGNDWTGGLIGVVNNGTIMASHSSAQVYGGGGNDAAVGGLVGSNAGDIIASYSTEEVRGGSDNDVAVGGLVGSNLGDIIASYSIGRVYGNGGGDVVGGLVGDNSNTGTIAASYATGDSDGESGNMEKIGGLAGKNAGTITASYATGDPNGGNGMGSIVGGLVGEQVSSGMISESYAYGTPGNVGSAGNEGSTKPSGAMDSPSALTGDSGDSSTYAGANWNSATDNTSGAWDFGSTEQNPALVYNDYDGAMGTTITSCGTDTTAVIHQQYPESPPAQTSTAAEPPPPLWVVMLTREGS